MPPLRCESGRGPGTPREAAARAAGCCLDGRLPPFQALRTRRWLYVAYGNGWRKPYDLRRDPYELQNLARDARLIGLRQRLGARLHHLSVGRDNHGRWSASSHVRVTPDADCVATESPGLG